MPKHSRGLKWASQMILWRLRRAVFLAKYEWFRSPPYFLRYHGFDLEYEKGDALVHAYSITAYYEPHVMNYLQSTLQRGATVVDAGANVGFFGFAVLALIPESNVHMFEPSPVPVGHLRRSIARNHLEARTRLNQCALYSEPGEMEYCVHAGKQSAYDGLQDTLYEWVGPTRRIRVPVTTVDTYVVQMGLKRLDLLKIDVEGAELYVLQGAKHTLKKLRPLVLFEVGEQNLAPYGLHPGDLHRFFQEHGYIVNDIHESPLSEAEFAQRTEREHEFVALPKASNG